VNNDQHPEWEAPALPHAADPADTAPTPPDAGATTSPPPSNAGPAPTGELPLDTWSTRTRPPSPALRWIGAAAGLAVVGGLVGAVTASRHTVTPTQLRPAAATGQLQQPRAGAFGPNGTTGQGPAAQSGGSGAASGASADGTAIAGQPPSGSFDQGAPPPGAMGGRPGGPGRLAPSGTSGQPSTSSRGS
jgi:hypothetical protein